MQLEVMVMNCSIKVKHIKLKVIVVKEPRLQIAACDHINAPKCGDWTDFTLTTQAANRAPHYQLMFLHYLLVSGFS